MSSSDIGPAVMPSGGSEESALYSLKRRLEALDAMVYVVVVLWKVVVGWRGIMYGGVYGRAVFAISVVSAVGSECTVWHWKAIGNYAGSRDRW